MLEPFTIGQGNRKFLQTAWYWTLCIKIF